MQNSWPAPDGTMIDVPKTNAPSPDFNHGDIAEIGASDIGNEVWATTDAAPLLMCLHCGAPQRRCSHSDAWALVQIPAILSGTLLSIEADQERAHAVYVVEGAGLTPPLGVYRTENQAQAAVWHQFRDELALLNTWSLM